MSNNNRVGRTVQRKYYHLRKISILYFCILAFTFSSPWALAVSAKKSDQEINLSHASIIPDENWHAVIRSIVEAENVEEQWSQLGVLMSMSEDSHQTLIRQLLIFSTESDKMSFQMAAGIIISYLHLPQKDVLNAVAPFIDSNNPAMREIAADHLLSYVDRRSRDRRPDFSYYKGFLIQHQRLGKARPESLLRLMYQIHPGEALKVVTSVYSDHRSDLKASDWSRYLTFRAIYEYEHHFESRNLVKEQAIKHMQNLANEGEWWERAYVAAVISNHTYLRSNALIQTLRNDPDQIVLRLLSDNLNFIE